MKISVQSTGDFNNTIRWLEKSSNVNVNPTLNRLGREGVSALSSATPKDTGGTAAGWEYKIESRGGYSELYFVNNSRLNLSVNLATILDSGHGTGTGGYVPPVNYIRPAISNTFAIAGDLILKEVNGK